MSLQQSSIQQQAKALLGARSLIMGINQQQDAVFDPVVFHRFVEFAVEFGATHLDIGALPFRYGTWVLPDNSDPYASWCNHNPSVLRVCPPEALQPWVPLADAHRIREMLSAQLAIMRPYGLKAVCNATEPMWLPEGVYRAHPRWRGPQCELGRIAARPYFAPSIDEPEVLALYREAMCEYCTLFPEIDQFSFLTNDSGGGISWSPTSYPGPNGPPRWRHRDAGARIAGWLHALQQGAADAGVRMRLNVWGAGWPAHLVESVRVKLDEDLFVKWVNGKGESMGVAAAGLSGGLWSISYPAIGLGDPVSFIEGLQQVYHNPHADVGRTSISLPAGDLELARSVMTACVEEPGTGMLHATATALRVAETLTGAPALAEGLVSVWQQVQRAQTVLAQLRQKGFTLALPFCLVSMRWLVRPLVPQPDLLTPEETAHYRDLMFAIEEQKDDPHFGLVLGKGVFRGESVMWMTRWCCQEAINILRGAQSRVNAIAKGSPDATLAPRLRLYAARIGALACLAATVKNTVMYQYALDISPQPQYGYNPMDYDDNIIYDMRALNLRKIAREELDNIADLLDLVNAHDEKVIEHAGAPDEESVFKLGVDVAAGLRRKMEIMLEHWHEYEHLYPTTKVWDFEPEPTGNL